MKKKCLTGLLSLCMASLCFAAPLQSKPSTPSPRSSKAHQIFMKKWDKDGDGKISAEERQAIRKERQAQFMKRWDKNGNGKIDPEERRAFQAEREKQGEIYRKRHQERLQAIKKIRQTQFDKDGDGKLSAQERQAMLEADGQFRSRHKRMREMVKKFDKDGDGKLNAEEREALRAEMRKSRKSPPRFSDGTVKERGNPVKKESRPAQPSDRS